jgi:hypothetical protein
VILSAMMVDRTILDRTFFDRMIVNRTIVDWMVVGGMTSAGMILLLETQAQRGIAGRSRLVAGLIAAQSVGYLLAPGRRIVRDRLASMVGRRVFGRQRPGQRRRVWRIPRRRFRRGLRDSGIRCGKLGGRAAANVTTKRTRHESQSYKKAKIRAGRITMVG